MRPINLIVVHSTTTTAEVTIEQIRKLQAEKSKVPMWHYLIDRKGNVHTLYSKRQVASQNLPHNGASIHIAYAGGKDATEKPADTRTASQQRALFELLVKLSEWHPKAEIIGASDLTSHQNGNPGFAVREWMYNYDYLSECLSDE